MFHFLILLFFTFCFFRSRSSYQEQIDGIEEKKNNIAAPSLLSSSSSSSSSPIFEVICFFFRCHGILLLLRSSTVLVTVALPSPRCMSKLLGGLAFNSSCYDVMFSGHTSLAFAIAYSCYLLNSVLLSFFPSSSSSSSYIPSSSASFSPASTLPSSNTAPLLRSFLFLLGTVLGILLACLSIISILLVRDHFSVDLLVAIYLSYFVCTHFRSKPPVFD
jgi:hypothetical protein